MKLAINIRNKKISAFSLVELAICFVIVSLLVGSVLATLSRASETEKYQRSKEKMDKIVAALRVYANTVNRLPCPSSPTSALNSGNYGLQRTNGSTCDSGALGSATTGNVYAGVVPTGTIGLPSDYMYDSWGRRFAYVVDDYAFANDISGISDAAAATNLNIIIKDGSDNPSTGATNALKSDTTNGGNIITSNAAFVLMSSGPNGSNAYLGRGGYSTITGGVNEDRNCTPNSSGAKDCSAYWNNVFIAAPASKQPGFVFDDIVIYKLKDELR